MVGKIFITKGIFFLILFFFSSLLYAGENKWVAVLLSDSEKAFEMPVRAFSDSIGLEVRIFNLHGDIQKGNDLKELIQQEKPALIFALGAKATFAAKLWTRKRQKLPVIFAMVLNWQKYNLLGEQSNITGISSHVNPGSQFLNLNMFAPKARRIGVIYSSVHSKEIVEQARQASRIVGLELVEKRIKSNRDLKKQYKKLVSQVDALWVPSDPVVYTIENMGWLEKRCIRDKLVCIGPSRNLTQMGFMLSVRPDMTSIGVQAASIGKNILDRGQKPSSIGVMEPLGTHIFLNKRTADRLDLHISSVAIDMVTEIIE